jgi:CarD family transcriptional regulator
MVSKTPTFEIGQRVVYPSQGVGTIRAIEERPFRGQNVPYYVIYLDSGDMTVMAPVQKAAELGLRATVDEKAAMDALDFIGGNFEPNPSDWKLRYQINMDLLKKGNIRDIAAIVHSLYNRQKVKELPILEKKLYESVVSLFEDELSYALKKNKEEIESMIQERLEHDSFSGESEEGDELDTLDEEDE